MSAAMTPRVRVLAICDEATTSQIEEGVYSLDGVRYDVFASTIPHRRSLSVYLLLSCARVGVFPGIVRVTTGPQSSPIHSVRIRVGFADENEPVAITVHMGEVEFPATGRYAFQVAFVSLEGIEVLKGEQPFLVHQSQGE